MKYDVIALGVTESCTADRARDRQRIEKRSLLLLTYDLFRRDIICLCVLFGDDRPTTETVEHRVRFRDNGVWKVK
jgi:hypothetical protein